jgi:hypothetical protein
MEVEGERLRWGMSLRCPKFGPCLSARLVDSYVDEDIDVEPSVQLFDEGVKAI